MLRLPVRSRFFQQKPALRWNSSSSFIRSTFIEYFVKNHGHKHVKSSSVVPLCDPTVPFVNAGMNQFKGVFLGNVDAPCPRVVNSQKCVRVGGKHNDLDIVGSDGHHHTFFEMLGNWSFGDYDKEEACKMAWDLLLGPYGFKPKQLVVTYFAGDVILNLHEDRECRDIWKSIGVPSERLKNLGAKDNFWEMGTTGPCGPCTEIHYINPDGSLTEIWNIVFIQYNREADGTVKPLRRQHVDTGMGLERVATILQNARSNYDTDLFAPIIQAIHDNSKNVSAYTGRFGTDSDLDCQYRRLADHARMISVCLADGALPATSLNLKQIMRKSFKISTDVFKNPRLLTALYDVVAESLGGTYPELVANEKDAKLIIAHEQQNYGKMRANLEKKWKGLTEKYPEVESLGDAEMSGFPLGYTEFKETMSKNKSTVIPGELIFKLYDTHGFQEHLIERIAKLNNLSIDKEGFQKLLLQHKSRHKTAFKEQSSNKGLLFHETIEKLIKNGFTSTIDNHKYGYCVENTSISFKPLKTKVLAIINDECEWIDCLEPCENKPYYVVTKDTNFYCEEGGQISDTGVININKNVDFKVNSVFKIRDFVFHKGIFSLKTLNVEDIGVKCSSDVILRIDSERRLNIMRNHTGVHLLNAAIRKVLQHSVVSQVGSRVTDKGLSLNLSVYGEKLSQDVVLAAQALIRESIQSNSSLETKVMNSIQLSQEANLVTVPGETYPETGLRMVKVAPPLISKELCCGTHVPSTGFLEDFVIMSIKGAGGQTPNIHALTGDYAVKAREVFSRAAKLEEMIEIVDPERSKEELSIINHHLGVLCEGLSGAASGELAQCRRAVSRCGDVLDTGATAADDNALCAIAAAEIHESILEARSAGREWVVHFVRSSYLMREDVVRAALRRAAPAPVLLLACAGGVISCAAHVPQELVTETFTAERWLRCVVSVFNSDIESSTTSLVFAEMTPAKASLITCEQLVQDAMRVAIKYAQTHAGQPGHAGHTGQAGQVGHTGHDRKDRRQN